MTILETLENYPDKTPELASKKVNLININSNHTFE